MFSKTFFPKYIYNLFLKIKNKIVGRDKVFKFFATGIIKILEENRKYADLVISNDILNLLCDQAEEKEAPKGTKYPRTKRKKKCAFAHKKKESKNAEDFKIICHLCSHKIHFEKMGVHLAKSHNVKKEHIERNVDLCFEMTESLKEKDSDGEFKENPHFVWVNVKARGGSIGEIDERNIDPILVEIRQTNLLKKEEERKIGFPQMGRKKDWKNSKIQLQ